MKYIPTFVAALLILNGCSKKPDTPVAPITAPPSVQPLVPPVASALPPGVLIKVEGKALTRDDLEEKISNKLACMMPPNMPPSARADYATKMEKRLRQQMMKEFLTRTVLLKRAEKEHFAITPEDEQHAFDRIKANNNLQISQEEFVRQNPLGGDGIQMIREEAQIGKLLAPYRTMPMEVTQQEMDAFTQRTRHMLQTPERISARRVLVAVSPDDSEETRAAKKAKAEQAREELVGGKDFAQIADAYSDGPEKGQGGDMGTFKRGIQSKEHDAAFAQADGEIGPVVQTEAGFEIIQVVEHMPAGTVDRQMLGDMLADKKRTDAENQFIRSLKDAADIVIGEEAQRILKLR